jgi:hypothetical protein
MKKIWSAILISVLFLSSSVRAGQESRPEQSKSHHHVLNLSLAFPLSTNSSKMDSANVNLTLFYGRMGSVRGLDLALAFTGLESSLEGVQLAGLAGVAGDSMTGWQLAGLLCVAGDRGQGVQLAGIGSVAGEEFSGFQAAGLFSVAGEHLEGAQLSGLFSVAGENATGFQASGLFSVAGEHLKGFQASGLFSVAGGNLLGVQLSGLFNVAGEDSLGLQVAGLANITGETCRGIQVSPFNVAGHLKGMQIGLVNVARNLDGIPVGLVNLTRKEDRRVRLAAWAGNVSLANVGVKIWAKRFYSILYAGASNLTQDSHSCLAYGFQYGYSVPVGKTAGSSGRTLRLDIDAGYAYLDNSTVFRHTEGTLDRRVLSLRGSLAVELSRSVSIFAGTGLGYRIDYGTNFASGKASLLIFGGVELF